MENHVAVLDACDYEIENNGTCILRGWFYAPETEKLSVQVRAEHVPVHGTLLRVPRPDVLGARPDLSFPDENAGFEIRIPNIEQISSLAGSLRVRLLFGEESLPLIQKEMAVVKQEYYHATLREHLEIVEKRGGDVYIQGWCINLCGKLTMKIQDEKGRTIQGAKREDIRRPDLSEGFGIEIAKCHGFSLRIPRETITSKELCLIFENPVTAREIRISMQKFDRENLPVSRVKKALGRENREKNREILKASGMKNFWGYLMEEAHGSSDLYSYYEKKHRAGTWEQKRQAKRKFAQAPLFSIVVPFYNTPLDQGQEMLDSVRAQSYGNWEICVADAGDSDFWEKRLLHLSETDGRIRYLRLKENRGIAENTNEAICMAKGEYLVFMDHDDFLEPDALYQAAALLERYPETELIYTDEDLTDGAGTPMYPHFKPDFNLDYLRCLNYICHMVVVKQSLLEKTGLLRREFDGAQDYDFLLRCVEQTQEIRHIPKVLYHWRGSETSTAGNKDSKAYAVEAGKKALSEHYERMGLEAEVEFTGEFIVYRTKFQVQGNPLVSILIPNKDHIDDLETCIRSIEEKSTWKNLEIIVIENNSEQAETFAYYEKLKKTYPNVKVVTYQGDFNYSAINNFGAAYGEGDYYLLLNNDTEVITPDWLERMLGYCQREDVGIAGAKLFYPDNTVQHAGVVIGMGGFAGHILTGYVRDYTGYMGRLITAQEISAVTGACLLVKRSVFEALHGLDEGFAVALNDVDFCLRAGQLGKKCVFVPEAELYHYESKSRGLESTKEKQERFQKEILRFQERYQELLEKGDPYYNPNLSLIQGDCSVRRAHETVKGKRNT